MDSIELYNRIRGIRNLIKPTLGMRRFNNKPSYSIKLLLDVNHSSNAIVLIPRNPTTFSGDMLYKHVLIDDRIIYMIFDNVAGSLNSDYLKYIVTECKRITLIGNNLGKS